MTEHQQLLAKSIKSDNDLIPHEATILGHLQAVNAASLSILRVTASDMLSAFRIDLDQKERFIRIASVAAAVHDVGKANDHFQGMILRSVERRIYDFRQALRHEWVSWSWLQKPHVQSWMRQILMNPVDIDIVAWCVCGHHPSTNRPTPPVSVNGAGSSMKVMYDHSDFRAIEKWLAEVTQFGREFSGDAEELLFIAGDPQDTITLIHREVTQAVARHENMISADYRLCAAAKACVIAGDVAGSALTERRVDSSGQDDWIGATLRIRPEPEDLELLVRDRLKGATEHPFQSQIAKSEHRVTLVNAGCGSGKTVAAWLWAARQCPQKRVFFSYPTTGTATEGFRGYLFDETTHQSKLGAKLFHSRSVIDLKMILDAVESDDDDALLRIQSLNAWSTPIICCTVDTVLGIMQNQRRGLYAWPALAQSAFVFDEIHAYDEKLFGCLLRFLADLRGLKVLLMTASLPEPRLKALQTILAEENETLCVIPGPPLLEALPRYYQESADNVLDRGRKEIETGGRVLWICNTVDRAMKVADEFATYQPLIYHSRFRYEDRVKQHRDVIGAFDRMSTSGGCIAVCTQVAEMSLDISATLLITETAPVPSLIQRLGRLNRHATPPKNGEPGPPTMPFIIVEPYDDNGKLRELPYDQKTFPDWPSQTRSWLAALGNHNISQQNLAAAWQSLAAGEVPNVGPSSWIDGGPKTQVDSVRDSSPGVTVVMAGEDAERCRRDTSEFMRVAIPMPQPRHPDWKTWKDPNGFLVAPLGSIHYDKQRGAQWQQQ